MPTLHELESEHGRDLAEHDYWARARSAIILEWVREADPDRIADVGCGSGYLTAAIADSGYDADGLDIDESLIEVASNRDTDATFRVGDARDLPYPDGSVDMAVYADVIEHFSNPAPLLGEARRVLTPDGSLVVSLPAFRALHGPHDDNQGHFDRYNPRRLRWLADRCGFEVLETRFTNAVPLLPYFLTQRVLKRDVPASARGKSPRPVEWLKDRLLDIEQAVDMPVGVTLLARLSPRRQPPNDGTDVVLMNYEYPPKCGGGGVFTHDLASNLRRNGHDIDIELVTGGAASATATNSVLDLMQFPFDSLPQLIRTIRRADPDLINAHFSLPTAALLPGVKAATGIPYVVNIMGADIHDPTRYHRFRPIMNALNRYAVLRHADRLIAPSTDMRNRLPKGLRLKTHVIPYFIDPTRFTPGVPATNDPLRLLTVARLVPRKNLDTTLEAVAELAKRREIEYSIVGSGSEAARLRGVTADLGLESVVDFHGYVDDADLPGVYADHDIFLLPSKHEAFGIVYLEALASGLPVVASDVGGQTDIITDGVGECVPPDDAGAIAEAVEAIADRYAHYAAKTRPHVDANYTPRRILADYERIYAEVADAAD